MNDVQHKSSVPTQQKTQLDYILLDGSGSMATQWYEMQDAIQSYVDGLKAENVNSQLIFHVFDSTAPDLIHRDVPIDQWVSLATDPINSYFGGTPLYDAVQLMCHRLRDLDPPRCSIVIVTDGEEAGSQFTSLVQAKQFLDWCRAKGWQVTFIGANFNNAKQAKALGADEHCDIGVEKKQLSNATSALAKKRARYGLYGESMHYTDDEKQQFGGYLNAPTHDDKGYGK